MEKGPLIRTDRQTYIKLGWLEIRIALCMFFFSPLPWSDTMHQHNGKCSSTIPSSRNPQENTFAHTQIPTACYFERLPWIKYLPPSNPSIRAVGAADAMGLCWILSRRIVRNRKGHESHSGRAIPSYTESIDSVWSSKTNVLEGTLPKRFLMHSWRDAFRYITAQKKSWRL